MDDCLRFHRNLFQSCQMPCMHRFPWKWWHCSPVNEYAHKHSQICVDTLKCSHMLRYTLKYTQTCIHTLTPTHTHAYSHTPIPPPHTHGHAHAHAHTHTPIHPPTNPHTCTTHTHTHTHMRMHTRAHAHTQVHSCRNLKKQIHRLREKRHICLLHIFRKMHTCTHTQPCPPTLAPQTNTSLLRVNRPFHSSLLTVNSKDLEVSVGFPVFRFLIFWKVIQFLEYSPFPLFDSIVFVMSSQMGDKLFKVPFAWPKFGLSPVSHL